MKSITKKISLLLILSAVLLLSSCLDSGSNSYTGTQEPCYITIGSAGIVYARTPANYLITSPKIKELRPGTIAVISYQVRNQEDETVKVDDNAIAYIVELGGEPVTLDQTSLTLGYAPEVPVVKFENIMTPIYAQNLFFGDLWIFPHTFKVKKGQRAKVSFYQTSEEDAKAADSDVLIDVRLEKLGTPDNDTADKLEGNNIVADFSVLRTMLADKANSQGKVSIKFRYYRSDMDKPYTSYDTYYMHIAKN